MEIEKLDALTNQIKEERKEEKRSLPQANLKGGVAVRKKSLLNRFVNDFFKGNVKNVKKYMVSDVLIPALQELVFDIGTKGLSMWLWDDTRNKKSPNNGSYTSYGSKYQSGGFFGNDKPKEDKPRKTSSTVDEHIFEFKEDAQYVQNMLLESVAEYGKATVAEYRSLVGEDVLDTDWKFGWTNLNDSNIYRVRGGYILRLPKPEPI